MAQHLQTWVITGSRGGVLALEGALDRYAAARGVPELLFVGDCPTGVDEASLAWAMRRRIRTVVCCADPARWQTLLTYALGGWPLDAVLCASWQVHGKGAGPMRNAAMLRCATPRALVLGFPGAQSRGTWHTINLARRLGHECLMPGGAP